MVDTTLYNGDCIEVMKKEIPDNSIDMVLCDLPYGSTACKWDIIIPFADLWDQYNRICKPNAAMVFTAAQPFSSLLGASNIENLRYEWIWQKPQGTNPLNAKVMPLKDHENILVFYRKKPIYNPQMWKSTPYGGFYSDSKGLGEVYGDSTKSIHKGSPDGARYPKTVLQFPQETGLHPTQKPVTLMEYMIKTYTNPGQVVLDNTMGSGTTGVAAINTGRNFIGIELDAGYFKTAQQRIKRATWL